VKIENKFKISGTTDRLVELIGIAKNVVAGLAREQDFQPLDETDNRIFKENLRIIRNGNDVDIPNDF
jgi:hypothetical protein